MYPENCLYSKEHEWVKIQNSYALIGVTHYAQEQLGDIVYLEFPEPGADLKQFSRCGVIESVKAVSDLYAPLTGKVIEVNQKLLSSPELVNKDPYGEGWMLKLEGWAAKELENLLKPEEYRSLIGVA